MIISIQDEFDLEKTVYSGQCFRPRRLSDGSYLFITGDKYLVISHISGDEYEVSCDEQTWNAVWFDYFDLGLEYSKIRASIPKDDTFMIESAIAGEGIRILRQNKWEMVISYIISQRKSIPAIKTSIERLSALCGDKIADNIYAFPTPIQILNCDQNRLMECGLGYRLPYIIKAAETLYENPKFFEELDDLDDEVLLNKLKTMQGVGDKVASCIALFGFHRLNFFPKDVWINKALDKYYPNGFDMNKYAPFNGVIQQYIFYAFRTTSKG